MIVESINSKLQKYSWVLYRKTERQVIDILLLRLRVSVDNARTIKIIVLKDKILVGSVVWEQQKALVCS